MTWDQFCRIVAAQARVTSVAADDALFGAGLDMTSVAFLEAILAIEEDAGIDIDVGTLDTGIVTAGQLFARIFPGQPIG